MQAGEPAPQVLFAVPPQGARLDPLQGQVLVVDGQHLGHADRARLGQPRQRGGLGGELARARVGAGIQSLPPNDLRHAFASLQIRAGVSVPELAEQMGHAPAMTIGTYTHVRELKGEPMVPAEEQIQRAREERPGRFGDAEAV